MKRTNSTQEEALKTQVKELQNQIEKLQNQIKKLKSESRVRIIISILINILDKCFV